MRRYAADWKLLGGFTALVFLIIVIGLIGILQITSLSKTVDNLGKSYLPMQEAVLEMRINNSLYARGIRNYVFWKSSRYLEAAKAATDLGIVQSAVKEFDSQLELYSSVIPAKAGIQKSVDSHFRGNDNKGEGSSEQTQWVKQIADSEEELRQVGSRIISLVDKNASLDAINKLIMMFESQLYSIDEFLDGTVQDLNLKIIRFELQGAGLRKTQAIFFLGWSILLAILIGTETAYFVYRSRKRERERREQLVQRMITMEEEERQHLSLQIHDQMGQDLSAMRIYLDLNNIAESKKLLDNLMKKTHNISELLMPPALDEVGLVDTIEALIYQYKQMTSINFVYQRPEHNIKLPAKYSLVLYRVAQEGLTNIAKYAHAKNVTVSLTLENKTVYMKIKDDGVGFGYGEIVSRPHRRRDDRMRLGLLGLKERVEVLGGQMEVRTAPGKGTVLDVEMPVG